MVMTEFVSVLMDNCIQETGGIRNPICQVIRYLHMFSHIGAGCYRWHGQKAMFN